MNNKNLIHLIEAFQKDAQSAGEELNEHTLFIYAKPFIDRINKHFLIKSGYYIAFDPNNKKTILRTLLNNQIAQDIENQINSVILNAIQSGEILLPRNIVRIEIK